MKTLLEHAKQCSVVTVPGKLSPTYATYHKANDLFAKSPDLVLLVRPCPWDVLVLPSLRHITLYRETYPNILALTGAQCSSERQQVLASQETHAVAMTVAMLEGVLCRKPEGQRIKTLHWLNLGSIGRHGDWLRMTQTRVVFYMHEKASQLEAACVKRGLFALGTYTTTNTDGKHDTISQS